MNFFSFKCCQEVNEDELEFDLEISPRLTSSSNQSIAQNMHLIKENLKTKLCLFIIYSNADDLLPFNELKKDKKLSDILSTKYFEIYKKTNDLLGQTIVKCFPISGYTVLCMILALDIENNNNFKLINSLKNEEITQRNLRKLIITYQYILYKPPIEPDKNDINGTNIMFRFIDESQNFSRRFDKKIRVCELYHLLKSKYPELQFRLFRISPSQELKNHNTTLEEENLYPNGIVQIVC